MNALPLSGPPRWAAALAIVGTLMLGRAQGVSAQSGRTDASVPRAQEPAPQQPTKPRATQAPADKVPSASEPVPAKPLPPRQTAQAGTAAPVPTKPRASAAAQAPAKPPPSAPTPAASAQAGAPAPAPTKPQANAAAQAPAKQSSATQTPAATAQAGTPAAQAPAKQSSAAQTPAATAQAGAAAPAPIKPQANTAAQAPAKQPPSSAQAGTGARPPAKPAAVAAPAAQPPQPAAAAAQAAPNAAAAPKASAGSNAPAAVAGNATDARAGQNAQAGAAAAAPAQPGAAVAVPAVVAPNQAALPTPAHGGLELPVLRYKLRNGLRVVMSPDKTVPTVGLTVYYDVGSRNEQRGRSGFAHLFEHMMFQGSANVGKGEHFLLVMNRGGSPNGTTSHDRTNYYQTLPANDLALGLWLEADRMNSLSITQENFENQRQTVMEERRQNYDNRPYMASMLRINELAYGDYFPYAHSTIGDMQDLRNAPLSAVQEFFAQHYTPSNAVLSLSGDFDPAEALKLVERYFGVIQARRPPAFAAPPLAPQTAERVESMLDPLAELPAFHLAYHIPPAREPDHYPLDLLAIVLGDGESSRLYQKLVKGKQLLQEVDVGTDARRGPDLLSVWGICAKGRSGAEARELIYSELSDIAERGISERELEKAKNRVRASYVFELESNLSRAMHLAQFELYFGDASLINREVERYAAVTRADVQRVAQQYFVPTNRTVLDVLPAKSAPAKGGAQ